MTFYQWLCNYDSSSVSGGLLSNRKLWLFKLFNLEVFCCKLIKRVKRAKKLLLFLPKRASERASSSHPRSAALYLWPARALLFSTFVPLLSPRAWLSPLCESWRTKRFPRQKRSLLPQKSPLLLLLLLLPGRYRLALRATQLLLNPFDNRFKNKSLIFVGNSVTHAYTRAYIHTSIHTVL